MKVPFLIALFCLFLSACNQKDLKMPVKNIDNYCLKISEFLHKTPGPVPWYVIGKPNILKYRNQTTDWNSIKGYNRKYYLHCKFIPLLIAEMYSIIYPVNNKTLVLASEINSTKLNLVIINLDTLEPINDLIGSCKSMDSSNQFLMNGLPESTVSVPLNLKRGKTKFLFDEKFQKLPPIIIVIHKWTSEVNNRTKLSAIYELSFNKNEINVIPQDWFNNGDYDFEYQWITHIARFPNDERLYGEGIRLGLFKLTKDGSGIEKWCIQDPFYRW